MFKFAKTVIYFFKIMVFIAIICTISIAVKFLSFLFVPFLIAGLAWWIAKMMAYEGDEEADKPP